MEKKKIALVNASEHHALKCFINKVGIIKEGG
jgi:hypothetical protein